MPKEEILPIVNESEVPDAATRRLELMAHLSEAYLSALDEQMGQLHNQFVAFISEAKLPLPQVLLVLEMLVSETVAQAHAKYLAGVE